MADANEKNYNVSYLTASRYESLLVMNESSGATVMNERQNGSVTLSVMQSRR